MPNAPDLRPPRRSLLDRAIASVAPGWAVGREEARIRLQVANTYAGSIGTRLSDGWGYSPPYNNGSLRQRREVIEMRQRAQSAFANNLVAKSILQTEVTNVVADGFTLQAKGVNAAGKVDDAVKAWRAECEDRWASWQEQADIRGLMDASELMRRPYRSARRDGDGGLLLVDDGGFSRLQHIPADKITTPYGRYGDPTIIDGVEVDATLAPVAFHILDLDEVGQRTWARVPADNFVFICPEQDDDLAVRGVTCFATIFDQLDELSGYVSGVVTAARMATAFGLIFKSDSPGTITRNLTELARGSDGQLSKAITIENGMARVVGSKDDVVQVNASQPMTQTPEFIRALIRQIGMPFDMPLELAAHDMSTVNFASARIGLLQYYRACRARQRRYKAAWSRVYRWWVSRERKRQQVYGAGNPNYGTFSSPFPARFFDHVLHARAWEYTDPVREAQGDALQCDMKWKSPQKVIAERGGDPDQVLQDWAAWVQALGLAKLPTDIRSTLTRDVISVRAQDPASVAGMDAGVAPPDGDPGDPSPTEPDEDD